MADTGDGMNDIISKALSDPRFAEIFGMLKEKADKGELDVSALSGLKNSDSSKHEKTNAESVGDFAGENDSPKKSGEMKLNDAIQTLSPLLSTSSKNRETVKHEALLCALKPYLTDNKKNAVDNILKVAKIGDILEIFSGDKK